MNIRKKVLPSVDDDKPCAPHVVILKTENYFFGKTKWKTSYITLSYSISIILYRYIFRNMNIFITFFFYYSVISTAILCVLALLKSSFFMKLLYIENVVHVLMKWVKQINFPDGWIISAYMNKAKLKFEGGFSIIKFQTVIQFQISTEFNVFERLFVWWV